VHVRLEPYARLAERVVPILLAVLVVALGKWVESKGKKNDKRAVKSADQVIPVK
jgi:hypothetical protein